MPARPTPAASPPQRRRAPETKGARTAARILDAAEPLFAERGYESTSLRKIADAVGLRIPSLYNHFESKDALYAAVLDRGLGPVLGMLDASAAADAHTRPETGELIGAIMALLDAHPHLPQLLLHETLSGGRRLTPILRERVAPIFEKAHQAARASDRGRRWSDEEIPLVVLALYHVVVGFHSVAPFYRATVGEDLLETGARERQTRFLVRLAKVLFSDEEPRGDEPGA